jgi:hypothetical protein
MFHTITLSNAMWGHLYLLPDYTRGGLQEATTTPEGHRIWPDFEEGKICVGKHAGENGYGFIHEFDPDTKGLDPKEITLHAEWAKRGNRNGDDYYIVRSERGRHEYWLSRDIVAGHGYPERMFAFGEDEDGRPLQRWELLHYLGRIGMRNHHGFWDPVTIWHGYYQGLPSFHNAIRAGTDTGPRYYESMSLLRGKLPDGYSWESSNSHYGYLHIEEA